MTDDVKTDLSDEDSGNDENSSNESDSGSDYDPEESISIRNNDANIVTSRDGMKWTLVSQVDVPGRFQAQNVFTAKSGTTAYCRLLSTPIKAFRLIVDEGFMRPIKNCTISFAQMSNEAWDISDMKLDAFIGLIYPRGCMNARNVPVKYLWSAKYISKAFSETVSRNRFEDIKKNIRFDIRSNRRERLQTDKFHWM